MWPTSRRWSFWTIKTYIQEPDNNRRGCPPDTTPVWSEDPPSVSPLDHSYLTPPNASLAECRSTARCRAIWQRAHSRSARRRWSGRCSRSCGPRWSCARRCARRARAASPAARPARRTWCCCTACWPTAGCARTPRGPGSSSRPGSTPTGTQQLLNFFLPLPPSSSSFLSQKLWLPYHRHTILLENSII